MGKPKNPLPPIAGRSEAAEILGIHPSHIDRVDDELLPKDGDRKIAAGPVWATETVRKAKRAIDRRKKGK